MSTWLLPGLDATGLLWRPLLDVLGHEGVRAVSYPDPVRRYDDVIAHLGAPEPGTVLVAESFSGPAAIRIAHAHRERVRAVVLVASFANGPRGLLSLGPLMGAALQVRPPALAIRALMVGMDADPALVGMVRDAIGRVPAATLAARLRESAATDVRRELAALPMPVVWLRATRDRLVPERVTRDAIAARPGLDVRSLDGPHLLAQARPREVAEIIRSATDRSSRP